MNDALRIGKRVFTYTVIIATIAWAIGLAAFMPLTAQAATITGGDLIKASGAAVYYYGADGKRYVFPNETTYKTWYSDFSTVKTITDAELAAISIGGNVTMRAGTKLAKITTDPKVYAVEPGGVLRWVETEAVASSLYGADWAKRVVDVPDAFFTNYSSGSSVASATYPTGSLVKVAGSSDVYYIDGSTKRKVDNESAFTGNMFSWGDVLTASSLTAYTDGSIISGKDSTLTNVAGGASVATGPLTVALASDTPASASVADNATANFTKVTFTTGANAVSVNSIYVTRYGLSTNTQVENIKFVGMDGGSVGTVASLNTDGRALVTFSPALALAANSSVSYYLRAGILDGTSAGQTVALGIAAASDVNSNAASVAGTFPVKGNFMTTVSLTIGTADVDEDGTVTDSTPDAGDTNVVVNKFKVTAGSTEAITIEAMTLMEAGTASLTDTKNIELYSVTQGKSLGEVSSWNSEGKATFSDLGIVIDKGNVHRFEVRVDIISGAGLTVNADLTDGSDVLVTVKGNTYGFYITPTNSMTNGKGAADQEINSGALVVSKSSSTAPTGNIAAADDQELVTFDFEAKGEAIKITSLRVAFDLTAGFVNNTDEGQITNIKIYDENGDVVAGPQNLGSTDLTPTGTGQTYEGYATFTDLIIVPIGTHKYTVKAKLANNVSTSDALVAGIPIPGTYITAKGYSTNDSVTASPTASNVNGNTRTVKAATLAVTNLTQPAARNVAKGVQDYIWAIASFDAAGSGEDIQVTSIIYRDTIGGTGTGGFDDIDNVELWADLTDANSARGDVYETKISSTEQPTATGTGNQTFSLSQTLIIKKDTFVKVALVGDLSTGATTDDTHRVEVYELASSVSATGADTGTDISANVTPAGDGGQAMTVKASGALTVSLDSTSPQASLLAGNTSGVTLGVFRFAADAVEDIELDRLVFTDDGSDKVVGTYYLYQGSNLISSQPGGPTVTFTLADGALTVPSNSYILLTVKGNIAKVDGSTVQNGNTVQVTIADPSGEVGGAPVITDNDGNVRATGKSSGATIDGYSNVTTDAAVDAAIQTVYESYPTVAFASDTPSGTLVPSANTLVAKVAVTAAAGQDITFDDADLADTVGGADNSIKFSINIIGNSDVTLNTITLKDGDGNQLDSLAGATDTTDLPNIASNATTATFDFYDRQFTVPAGQTKYLYVYANTSELTDTGDSIQLWLDDSTGTNIDWDINDGGNSYNHADILFRGDLFGGALSKP